MQQAADLARLIEHIRRHRRIRAQSAIEIGRRLIDAKAALGHGNFLPWLAREFDWSEETARNYMRVAQHFGDLNRGAAEELEAFDLSALYALAAPSTPPAAREAALERAAAGERITKAEADRMIAEAKAA